jgi:hypothetical protein
MLGLRVVADHREFGFGVPEALRLPQHAVVVASALASADYVIDETIGVERKTGSNLTAWAQHRHYGHRPLQGLQREDYAGLGVSGGLSFSSGDLPADRMFMKRFRRSNQKGAPRETAKAVRARPASLFNQSH